MLVDVPLHASPAPLPQRVRDLLDDADERIERFTHDHRDRPVPAYVPCDFVQAHHALRCVVEQSLAPGGRFAEWGSGVGVVTCLAAMQGFDAIGIEIEEELVELSIALADDHTIDAEFLAGSFVPEGADEVIESNAYDLAKSVTWLRTDAPPAYDDLGLDPDDFDLVFAYPWPGEEQAIFDLFDEFAGVGALLMTHHGENGMRLQRKRR